LRYDLNAPPVVITTSRWKLGLLLVASLAFVIGSVALPRDPTTTAWIYSVTVFFAICALALLWRIVTPARLELSPNGLRWFNGVKTEEYAWREFAEFRAYAPARTVLGRHVGFILAPNSSKLTKASGAVRSLAGVDGSFGGFWLLGTKELVDLLNGARVKWSLV
jgi:hypothetical protein